MLVDATSAPLHWHLKLGAPTKAFLVILMASFWGTALPAQETRNIYTLPKQKDTAEIIATINRGSLLQSSNLDSSIVLLKSALQQSYNAGYEYGTARALISLGSAYISASKIKESFECYYAAIPHTYKSLYDTEILCRLYTGMGAAYYTKGNYSLAAYYYYRALQEVKPNRLENAIITCHLYLDMSALWSNMKQYSYAINYLWQAERIAIFNKDTLSLTGTYINIGSNYGDMGELDKAYPYNVKGEELASKKHYLRFQQIVLGNIGDNFRDRHEQLKAIPYYQKALSLTDGNHAYQHHISSYYKLAFAYYETANYSQAKIYALYALKEQEQLGVEERNEGTALWMLADIYQREQLWKQAHDWLLKYIAYSDSATKKETDKNTNGLELKYRLSEKDKIIVQNQLLLTKKEIELKNENILVGSVSGCVLLLSVLLVSYYRISKHKQYTQAEKIVNLEQGKEIGLLKAMLEGEEKERIRLSRDLHDGIGGMLTYAKLNLGSIQQEYPEISETIKVNDVIGLLNDIAIEVRQTAHNLMPDVLIKNGLQKALLLYCSNINTGNQLNIELQFHGALNEIDKSAELILYRITQELIQNIIKHAHADKATIQLIQDKDRLNLIVEDNGQGFDITNNTKNFGLQNLQFRVQALHGYISITSIIEGGTSVYIEFDLQKLRNI